MGTAGHGSCSLLELPFSEGSDREFLFCSLHCVIGGVILMTLVCPSTIRGLTDETDACPNKPYKLLDAKPP